jgi:hypothetical protein
MQATHEALDPERVQAFAGQVFQDLGAALSGALTYLGDRLGLFKSLAAEGPATPKELAARTGTAERYVREWLGNQASGGYVTYDPGRRTYALPPEHAAVLADEEGTAFMAGGFTSTVATFQMLDRIEQAFRTGEGVGWHEHDERLFHGCERFYAPAYRAHRVQDWIPALQGLPERLDSVHAPDAIARGARRSRRDGARHALWVPRGPRPSHHAMAEAGCSTDG